MVNPQQLAKRMACIVTTENILGDYIIIDNQTPFAIWNFVQYH